ncbi:hypothetical protein N0V90_009961 [Kalmusia sp. IMI 367209]|nr:hypothetical protein N0V90_009961 [Kalmusia sp. IMI 367209]
MKSFTFAFIASLIGLSTAAPLEEKRWPSYATVIKPSYNYLFSNQHFTYSPTTGKAIFEHYNPYTPSTSTISTFIITAAQAASLGGKKVRINFWYDGSEAGDATGSVIQIYSSLKAPSPLTGDSDGSNQRNQHIGTVVVQKGGEATEASGSPQTYKTFEFPKTAGNYAFEVVPTAILNPVNFQWNTAVSGLFITVV